MTYLLLAASAFAAQALMFVPIVPLLVGTGALVAHGQIDVTLALTALTLGIAAGDLLWYGIGRRRGLAVLGRLCRLALEPSTCLRRTENLFARWGAAALLFAKFVPGLSTVALPLAGVFRMRPLRFIAHDVPGVLLWVGAYVLGGYFTSGVIAAMGTRAPWSGRAWLAAGVVALGAYLAWKQWRRRALLQQLRGARMTVEDLRTRLGVEEPPAVIDLRHALEFEADPYVIPGAIHIPVEQVRARRAEIPLDREIVVYCTCPDEVTSAREALRLRSRSVRHVRPLQGGLTAWRAAGFEVEQRGPIVGDDDRTLNAA